MLAFFCIGRDGASAGYRAALVFGIRVVVTGIRMALGFRTANSVCLRRFSERRLPAAAKPLVITSLKIAKLFRTPALWQAPVHA